MISGDFFGSLKRKTIISLVLTATRTAGEAAICKIVLCSTFLTGS